MKSCLLSVIFTCLFVFLAEGQTADSLQAGSDKDKPTSTKLQAKVIEMDGIVEVAGHFGKKLINEIGSRVNLIDGDTEAKEKIKVVMKVGPFRIERYE